MHKRSKMEVVHVAELLPWLPPAVVGGFLSAVLYAILRGSLVPRSTVDARIAELQQVVVLWKEAAAAKEAVVAQMIPLVRQSVDNDELIIALIGALKEARDRLETSTPSRRDGERE